jgi:hypothetical protein
VEIPVNAVHHNLPARTMWAMLAVSAIWALLAFGSHYASCRADGSSQVLCFVLAVFFDWFEIYHFCHRDDREGDHPRSALSEV